MESQRPNHNRNRARHSRVIYKVRVGMLLNPLPQRVEIPTLALGTDAAEPRVRQTPHGLAYRVQTVRDVVPVVQLLPSVVRLVEAGADYRLFFVPCFLYCQPSIYLSRDHTNCLPLGKGKATATYKTMQLVICRDDINRFTVGGVALRLLEVVVDRPLGVYFDCSVARWFLYFVLERFCFTVDNCIETGLAQGNSYVERAPSRACSSRSCWRRHTER